MLVDQAAADRRPTIKDVARVAGVSVATVSNVMNGHAHVRERTRAKVRRAIDTLGYRVSRAARSLPVGRTYLLAYCLPSDANYNAALNTFLHQVVASATDAGLEVLLVTQKGGDQLQPYRDLIERGGADGFVLSGIGYGDERVDYLGSQDIPFACFGRADDPTVPAVDVDGAAGTAAAVEHLRELGHERIAFVAWPEGSATGDDRLDGYRNSAAALGLDADAVVRSLDDFDLGRKLVPDLMRRFSPTAVVCVSDLLALGVVAGLRDHRLAPGADVAVTGFDDIPAASLSAPALTSLRQPLDRVGALLVERLVAQVNGTRAASAASNSVSAVAAEPHLVEPDLIVRDSSGLAIDRSSNHLQQPIS